MKNEANVKHHRYYIFKLDSDGNPMYYVSQGGWIANFQVAQLWANYDFVKRKALQLQSQEKKQLHLSKCRDIIIGKVDVVVNGHFNLEVVQRLQC